MTRLASKLRIRWTPRSLTALFFWWLWAGRPSVLWRFVVDYSRHLMVNAGLLRDTGKHLADVRTEFEAQAARGQFQELWFDINIEPWCLTFPKLFNREDPLRILEIGSWEGRSTLFFETYFPNAHITAVDTWAGSDEWHYNATSDLQELEVRFDRNVAIGGSRVTKRKGSSLKVLPQLLEEEQKFDLIYVDGSHLAEDALTDSINAWRLLKAGGMVIFDDVMWPAYSRTHANTAWAINLFLKFHAHEYKVLHSYYQLILQKKEDYIDQPAEWVQRPAAPVSLPEPTTKASQTPTSDQELIG